MSIESEIQRLSGVRGDIFDSITNKGVTVPATATFSSCPDLIDSIVTGGGAPSSFINTGFSADGSATYYREFTATQVYNPGISVLNGGLRLMTQKSSWPYSITAEFDAWTDDPMVGCSGLIYGARSDAPYSAFSFTLTGGLYYDEQNDPSNPTDSPIGTWSVENGSTIFSAYITAAGLTFENEHTYYGYYTGGNFDDSLSQMMFSGVSGDFGNAGYPYPTYPSATTGYMSGYCTGTKYGTAVFDDLHWIVDGVYQKISYYDNSPSQADVSDMFSSEILNGVAENRNDIETKLFEYIGPVEDSNYTYEYGPETTSYSGYQGW